MKKFLILALLLLIPAITQARTLRILCTNAYTEYTMAIPDVRSHAFLRDLTGRTFLRVTLDDGSLLDVNAAEIKVLR